MTLAMPAALAAGSALLLLAHGDAVWIQRDPKYLAADGVHCCGVNDCRPAHPGEVIEQGDAYLIAPSGQRFEDGAAGLHASIDQRYWVCLWQNRVRCLFVPRLTN